MAKQIEVLSVDYFGFARGSPRNLLICTKCRQEIGEVGKNPPKEAICPNCGKAPVTRRFSLLRAKKVNVHRIVVVARRNMNHKLLFAFFDLTVAVWLMYVGRLLQLAGTYFAGTIHHPQQYIQIGNFTIILSIIFLVKAAYSFLFFEKTKEKQT
jgi:predicted RNA-binding Zn-ribbon protein involved in translation (DUF1610 family)